MSGGRPARIEWTKEALAALRDMRNVKGLSWEQIGLQFGLSWTACYEAAKKHGIPMNRGPGGSKNDTGPQVLVQRPDQPLGTGATWQILVVGTVLEGVPYPAD